MMNRVREIVNPIRYDQQQFGKFLLRTDTSLVFYNRTLMRTDSFLTFFLSFVYAWLPSPFSVFSQLAQVGFLGRRHLFLSVFQRKMKLKMTVGLCQPFFSVGNGNNSHNQCRFNIHLKTRRLKHSDDCNIRAT